MQEQARIKEYRAFVEKITKAFEGTEYEEKTEKIIRFIEGRDVKTPRLLYTGSMHEFGRDDGRAIYQVLFQLMKQWKTAISIYGICIATISMASVRLRRLMQHL